MNEFDQHMRAACAALEDACARLTQARPQEAIPLLESAVANMESVRRLRAATDPAGGAPAPESVEKASRARQRMQLLVASAETFLNGWRDTICPAGSAYGADGTAAAHSDLQTVQVEG